MLSFSMRIANPWSNNSFDTLYSKIVPVSTFKSFEFEVCKNPVIAEVAFAFAYRTYTSGVIVDIGLFGYTLTASLLDIRPWHNPE